MCSFFQVQNTPKLVFGRDSARTRGAGGAHDAPPDSLVSWGGGVPSPYPLLNAFCVSTSAPRLAAPNTNSWLRLCDEGATMARQRT